MRRSTGFPGGTHSSSHRASRCCYAPGTPVLSPYTTPHTANKNKEIFRNITPSHVYDLVRHNHVYNSIVCLFWLTPCSPCAQQTSLSSHIYFQEIFLCFCWRYGESTWLLFPSPPSIQHAPAGHLCPLKYLPLKYPRMCMMVRYLQHHAVPVSQPHAL